MSRFNSSRLLVCTLLIKAPFLKRMNEGTELISSSFCAERYDLCGFFNISASICARKLFRDGPKHDMCTYLKCT